MKTSSSFFLFIVLLLLHNLCLAQSKPVKRERDTSYYYVNFFNEVAKGRSGTYIRKMWPQNGRFVSQLLSIYNLRLIETSEYSDLENKVRNGVYLRYHLNGILSDSGSYLNNKKEGTFIGWYESGNEHYIKHFKNDLPVDTGMVFTDKGQLSQLTITNETGNGLFQDYYESGKVRCLGKLQEGKRNGMWIVKREDGTKKMQLDYLGDSLVSFFCFGFDGKTTQKEPCIVEQLAVFPGGTNAWVNFLRENLNYPEIALKNDIQGNVRVQFYINTDGSVSDLLVLDSPHASLSLEALRIMSKSPRWIPGILFNETARIRHIQNISFFTEEAKSPDYMQE